MIKIEIEPSDLSDMMRHYENLSREAAAANVRATLAEDKSWKLADEVNALRAQPNAMRDVPTINDMLHGLMIGDKIQAIKACRVLLGLGLKEAKDLIESVQTGCVNSHNVPRY